MFIDVCTYGFFLLLVNSYVNDLFNFTDEISIGNTDRLLPSVISISFSRISSSESLQSPRNESCVWLTLALLGMLYILLKKIPLTKWAGSGSPATSNGGSAV